jgi:hypothetical protein
MESRPRFPVFHRQPPDASGALASWDILSVAKNPLLSAPLRAAFSPAELRQVAARARADFVPAAPRETQLALVEVDPMRVHVSWQIRGEDLRQARGVADSGAPLVLRLHDLAYMDFSGANPHATQEIPLTENHGSRYFTLAANTRTVQAEIGLRGAWRELTVLARSPVLRVPPVHPAVSNAPRPSAQSSEKPYAERGKEKSRRFFEPSMWPETPLPASCFPLAMLEEGREWEMPAQRWQEMEKHFPALGALLRRDARWRTPRLAEETKRGLWQAGSSFILALPGA